MHGYKAITDVVNDVDMHLDCIFNLSPVKCATALADVKESRTFLGWQSAKNSSANRENLSAKSQNYCDNS